jgi:hypothetical protein
MSYMNDFTFPERGDVAMRDPRIGDYLRTARLLAGVPSWLAGYSVTNMFAPNRFDSYTLKPSASCLQCGMPNFPAMYALTASINYLNDIRIE